MTESPLISREALHLLTGDKISQGMSREIYGCRLVPDCVVKIEDSTMHFQNVIEWETWQSVRGTQWEKWFCPCAFISHSGSLLVMKRTSEIPDGKYPKRMPVFLTDFKWSNYGLYKGRVVCHDYGTNLLMEYGKTERMRKVYWSGRSE